MRIFAYNDFILKKFRRVIYGDDSHVLFIKHTVRSFFTESILGSRVRESEESGFYEYTSNEEDVLALPDYESVSEFLKKPSLFTEANEKLSERINDFDVFWLTWPHPISFLILWKVGKKKERVLFIRQNLEELIKVRYQGLGKFAGLLFTRFMYAYARVFHRDAIIVTVGEEMYHRMKKTFPKVFFISDCIVPQQFSIPAREALRLKKKLIFVGRLEPEKGLFVLLKAFQKLIDQDSDFQLTIVGDGVCMEDLKLEIANNQLEKYVHLEGYVPFGEKLFELYKSHDIMVVSSFSEGLPKIINEARAFSLPIVSTEVGGIANELKDQKTCLFVPPNNSDELASSIFKLANSPSLYQEISLNLHKEFETNSLEYWSKNFSEIIYQNASNA